MDYLISTMGLNLKEYFGLIDAALNAGDTEEKQRLVARIPDVLPVLTEGGRTSEAEVMTGNLSPGRPALPELVHPGLVGKRRLNSEKGRLALIHAVAHIEFNAINLALDAAWRFRGHPAAYYQDWISVAKDEARHFGWLQCRLQELGSAYGELQAHNGLWDAAVKTAHDPMVRMALVPRVLEARGLDVTPGMIKRLVSAGDNETAAILVNILNEEVAHVEIGSRWYRYFCAQKQLDPVAIFPGLLEQYMYSLPRGPFNMDARKKAGFSESELNWLASLDAA